MGSKSIRDGNSPTSSFLLPQLRQSRRGSLASLSSTTQLDKETLSQALDQIHSTASQTETLTIFNQYTSPPSSSSGPDSKGIAGELQGGISGLYSRLRASVGNVRDIVNPGGENTVAETTSSNSPKAGAKSPVPSSKNTLDPPRVSSSSADPFLQDSTPETGRQSPSDASITNLLKTDTAQTKSSTVLPGSRGSRSNPGSVATLKSPPATVTHPKQPTTAGPALAEVNISAVKQGDFNVPQSSDQKSVSLTDPIRTGQDPISQNSHVQLVAQGDVEKAAVQLYQDSQSSDLGQRASKTGEGVLDIEHANIQQTRSGKSPGAGELGRSVSGQSDPASLRPFPGLDGDGDDEAAYAASDFSSDADGNDNAPPRIVTNHGNAQDDVFTDPSNAAGTGGNHELAKKKGYQHLELPLQKSMAPPLISRSHSENPSLTRVSSSGTNTDSLASSALPTFSNTELKAPHKLAAARTSTSRPADPASVHRDLRTMNVFSQVKNKVLNKEYWMKDQNAKDCFYCGDPFSTFRRKHHCSK